VEAVLETLVDTADRQGRACPVVEDLHSHREFVLVVHLEQFVRTLHPEQFAHTLHLERLVPTLHLDHLEQFVLAHHREPLVRHRGRRQEMARPVACLFLGKNLLAVPRRTFAEPVHQLEAQERLAEVQLLGPHRVGTEVRRRRFYQDRKGFPGEIHLVDCS
jgi:hypothetical protein